MGWTVYVIPRWEIRLSLMAAYICTGFNHLHQVPNAQKETSDLSSKHLSESDDSDAEIDEPENFDKGNYAPEGRRVWSWLILCDDGALHPSRSYPHHHH